MTLLTVRPQISLWYYGTVVLEISCGAHRKGRGTKKKSSKQFFSFRVEFYDTCSRPIALPHRKPAKALCSWSRWRPRQRLLAAARQQALGLAEMRTVVGRCRARPSAGGAGAPVRNTCYVPGTGDGRWMHTGFRQGAGSAALIVPRSAPAPVTVTSDRTSICTSPIARTKETAACLRFSSLCLYFDPHYCPVYSWCCCPC